MKNAGWLGLMLLVACSPAAPTGTLSGKVTVENGSPKGVVVHIEGPTGAGAVTDDTGNFEAKDLADGTYAVSATIPGAEVPTVAATVVVKSAKPDKDAILAFKVPAAVAGGIGGKLTGGSFTGATVSITGPISRGAVPMTDGSYSFDKLPDGSYLLTAEVLNTLEGRQSVVVGVMGSVVTVPDLAFTPVGTFDVVVKTSAGPAAVGAQVSVLGQGQSGLTDATGHVTMRRVLAGMRAVSAVLGTSTATSMTTVVQGAGADVTLTLTDLPPAVGTVKGSVQFMSSQSAAVISVSSPGIATAVRPDTLGNFSVANVPVGQWEFFADAPGFPRLKLGVANVLAGKTTTLAPGRMSFYFRYPIVPNLSVAVLSPAETVDFGLMAEYLNPAGNNLYLVDLNAMTRRPIVSTSTNLSGFNISRNGKWISYGVATVPPILNVVDTLTLLTRVAATQTTLSSTGGFSKDESVLFSIWNDGLHRYDLLNSKDDLFPGNGWIIVGDVAYQNAATVQMVGTTGTATTLFTNVTTFSAFPVPWALTDCVATNCTARILPPGTTTAVSIGAAIQGSASWQAGSTAEYGVFSPGPLATATQVLVKMSDGSKVNLPPSTFQMTTNGPVTGLPATRVAYLSTAGANRVLREEALPATGSAAPLVTSTGLTQGSYLSATRLIANDTGNSKVVEVKSGVVTLDDATFVSVSSTQAGASWRKTSTSKFQVTVADSPVVETSIGSLSATTAYYKAQVAISEPQLGGASGISVYDGQALRSLPGFSVVGGAVGKTYFGMRPLNNQSESFGVIGFSDDVFHELVELPTVTLGLQTFSTRTDGVAFVCGLENAGTAISGTLLGKIP